MDLRSYRISLEQEMYDLSFDNLLKARLICPTGKMKVKKGEGKDIYKLYSH